MDSTTFLLNALCTAAAAALLYALSSIARALYDRALYSMTVTLEIPTDRPLQWSWLQHYLTEHLGLPLRYWTASGNSAELEATLIPVVMRIPFEGKLIRVRIYDAPPSQTILRENGYGGGGVRRMATLWCRGADRAFFARFLLELKRVYVLKHNKYVQYFVPLLFSHSGDASWHQDRSLYRRPLASLTLDPALVSRALAELDYFMSPEARDFKRTMGIPYHFGFLLDGPPGNGKSSFILALASYAGAEVCKLALQSTNMDDNALAILMKGAPEDDPPRFIVLEDIDCLTATTREGKSKISFSALMNCLDGLGAPENAVIIMTTNFPDKLDPALIRPGRVDCRLTFLPPTDARIAEHYVKFHFGEQVDSQRTRAFVAGCRQEDAHCSMALVQGRILREMGNVVV